MSSRAPCWGSGLVNEDKESRYGTFRKQYAAGWSPDPVGPDTWAPLGVGSSKVRTVTGASGTKVWVRFAAVREQLQSDWSTPVLVTIP